MLVKVTNSQQHALQFTFAVLRNTCFSIDVHSIHIQLLQDSDSSQFLSKLRRISSGALTDIHHLLSLLLTLSSPPPFLLLLVSSSISAGLDSLSGGLTLALITEGLDP